MVESDLVRAYVSAPSGSHSDSPGAESAPSRASDDGDLGRSSTISLSHRYSSRCRVARAQRPRQAARRRSRSGKGYRCRPRRADLGAGRGCRAIPFRRRRSNTRARRSRVRAHVASSTTNRRIVERDRVARAQGARSLRIGTGACSRSNSGRSRLTTISSMPPAKV